MKKCTLMMMVIILATIALGSVCGAGDKNGYVVKETFTYTLVKDPLGTGSSYWGPKPDSNEGRVYCANNDFVTGCSYALETYPGITAPSDYDFKQVIPIQCSPPLMDEDSGVATCKGCLAVLYVKPFTLISDPAVQLDGKFRVYTYCGSPYKK